jgi:hypothetical protein
VEYAGKVLEETQYVAQNARSGLTNSVVGFGGRLETVVGFQLTNCSQVLSISKAVPHQVEW